LKVRLTIATIASATIASARASESFQREQRELPARAARASSESSESFQRREQRELPGRFTSESFQDVLQRDVLGFPGRGKLLRLRKLSYVEKVHLTTKGYLRPGDFAASSADPSRGRHSLTRRPLTRIESSAWSLRHRKDPRSTGVELLQWHCLIHSGDVPVSRGRLPVSRFCLPVLAGDLPVSRGKLPVSRFCLPVSPG
jgi:hypothetical protein